MIYSLDDLRTELGIELRNESGTNARYSELEMNVAIRRATNMLSEYFWHTSQDSSKSFVSDTYTYTYDEPVRNFEKVAFRAGNDGVYQYTDSWYEPIDGTLVFMGDHVGGETIYVWYNRHPDPYPDDLTLDGEITGSAATLTIDSSTPVYLWPSTGYFKMNNEIFKYTAWDADTNTMTIVRNQFNTAVQSHADDSTLSYINLIDKPVFYEGVKDLAMAYLQRIRIVDIPASEAQGNVTIMREIMEGYRRWIQTHRMRTQKQTFTKTNSSSGMRTRRRGK